jgi:hypothetical protein
MSKIIYIITDEYYSDYSIIAVFTKKKLAEKYTSSYGGRIEEWEADLFEQFINKGLSYYTVMMKPNGDVHGVQLDLPDEDSKDRIAFLIDGSNNLLFSYSIATSEERAIKIANERRTMIITENLWGKEYEDEINQRLGLT